MKITDRAFAALAVLLVGTCGAALFLSRFSGQTSAPSSLDEVLQVAKASGFKYYRFPECEGTFHARAIIGAAKATREEASGPVPEPNDPRTTGIVFLLQDRGHGIEVCSVAPRAVAVWGNIYFFGDEQVAATVLERLRSRP